ncbi:MAG: DUF503 domain-containing protein [Polyangiaceae bacterium]
MFVGVARLTLQIPGARSLKDRRQVVKSFKERVRARLPVSIAEVGDVERHQVASLGAATVGHDSTYCTKILSELRELAGTLPDAILADVRTEILSFGPGGEGIEGGIESSLGSRSAPPGDFSDLAEKWGKG